MDIKNKILLKISWYIGIIAFIGGWTIFLTWAGGRYIGAWDFEYLEHIGFIWMIGFFWMCLIALILLFTYIIINRNKLHFRMLYAALMNLINIPSVLIILQLQYDIQTKVFVRLTNNSGLDNIELKLQGNLETWELGIINKGTSKVINYDPPLRNIDARKYQEPDTLNLIIKHNSNYDTIGFPTLSMGDCKHLIIDEKLKLK